MSNARSQPKPPQNPRSLAHRPANVRPAAAPETIDPEPVASTDPIGRFDLMPTEIRFVIHRQATPRWRIADLAYGEHVTLAYAAEGRAEYRCAGATASIAAGQMLLFDANVPHSAAADAEAPWRFYSTAFRVATVDVGDAQSLRSLAALPWHVDAENRVAVEALFAELDARWVARELGFELRCRAIVLTLLHAYVEAATRRLHREPRVRAVVEIARFLQERYAESFAVADLAARAGLSESRFRVLFKRTMGVSVVRYQNGLRVNRARGLLLSGEHSVSESAALVGVPDVYYFSRMFKDLTGTNPSTLIPR